MLRIHNEFTQTPEASYVSGWFNDKLFEFTYFHEVHEFRFGTAPFINGRYESCEPLLDSEQEALIDVWLTGNYTK